MLHTAMSICDRVDISDAISKVIADCRNQLNGAAPQAGIVFTSRMDIDFAELLEQINAAFPGILLIGCTTDGEITSEHGHTDDAVALLLFASEHVQFATAVAENISNSPIVSFQKAFDECREQLASEPVFGITLPDGLSTAGVSLDMAIQQAMGQNFPVFGGTAGDNFQLTGTYQFHGNTVYSDSAPLLVFGGDVEVDAKICIGVEPIGRFYSIDSSRDNVLYTIDGQKAADVYEELFGEHAYDQEAIQFPLAIYEDGETDFYLRDPFKVNRENGSVEFIGTFPKKCRARFITVDCEHILRSADTANTYLLNSFAERGVDIILLFSCTSRKYVLGSQANQEFRKLFACSSKVPFFGFYCYGEIGPLTIGEPTRFHNDTYVAVGLRFATP